jgi:hypothetical protein
LLQPSDHDAAHRAAAVRALINKATYPGLSRRCCAFVQSEHAASSARGAEFGTPKGKFWGPKQITGRQQNPGGGKTGPRSGSAGRGTSRSAPPGAICELPSGAVGSIAFLVCKKRHVMPYICWTGPSCPHSNVPKPRLRSKIFRGRTWGSKPICFQGAAERGGGQYRRTNPNNRVPRHN